MAIESPDSTYAYGPGSPPPLPNDVLPGVVALTAPIALRLVAFGSELIDEFDIDDADIPDGDLDLAVVVVVVPVVVAVSFPFVSLTLVATRMPAYTWCSSVAASQ